MKTVGLITEYNPFHNGHLYHIAKSKELTSADAVIVIMSGNYVQRGTPAFMPKHLRTEMALRAGASVVFELPVCYASGSAEYFAFGAVSLLDKLGCVNALCFGSESGELSLLSQVARILSEEPIELKDNILYNLKQGLSYPAARTKALADYAGKRSIALGNVLATPNNILGIEYLKALYLLNSSIIPYTIKREGSDYHESELHAKLSSASAIRNILTPQPESSPNAFTELESQVPTDCLELLRTYYEVRYPIFSDDCSLLLKFKLLSETKESLTKYADVSDELANKIINQMNNFMNWEQFCKLLKTKDITYTRINRALLHILIDIKKHDYDSYMENGYHFYAHMLGFRKDAETLLTQIKKYSSIPILSKPANTSNLPQIGLDMLNQDIYCANLYESIVTGKFKKSFIHECEQSIIRI